MCDDHAALDQGGREQGRPGMSRRHFVHGTAAAAAAATLLRRTPRLPLRSAARAAAPDGTSAYSMAMHIHSSFSEYGGSMDSQLFQATTNSVDVLWWTDHDARMEGIGYRDVVHFTSLGNEQPGKGQGSPWKWKKTESGPVATGSGGGIVTSPSSPNDPVSGGSLHLAAKSGTSATARYGYYANAKHARLNYRDNLTGQTLNVDVLLDSGWSKGYLELLIGTSYHPATGGRPAGLYALSYRFVPSGAAGRTAQGNTGVITVPVDNSGGWYTAALDPATDLAALWPDLDYRDFALFQLTLSAASTGDLVSGYFDYLRFSRSISGETFLNQQADMSAALASKYPHVVQRQGLEVSWLLPHMNWFGGDVVMTDYGGTKPDEYVKFLATTQVPRIHKGGGLVSYNHPYGTTFKTRLPPTEQDTLLSKVATTMLPTGSAPAALGADILEVGYNLRAGVDLAHHIALWDIMSRNAAFLTGAGTSDDHHGDDWQGIYNNWITSVWAASTGQSDLLAALAAGRAWGGAMSYRGHLDLLVDGSVPMGAVSVSSVTARKLSATATGIPSGGSLQVLQGAVDYAGTAGLTSNAKVIATYSAAQLASGSVTLTVNTSADSFVRTQVRNSGGGVVGLSNPVWLLRTAPPGGIPAPRQA